MCERVSVRVYFRSLVCLLICFVIVCIATVWRNRTRSLWFGLVLILFGHFARMYGVGTARQGKAWCAFWMAWCVRTLCPNVDGKNREIVFRCFHSFHLSPYSFIYWYHWVDRIYSLSAFSGFCFCEKRHYSPHSTIPEHVDVDVAIVFALLCELCSVFYWLLFIYFNAPTI